MNIFPRPPTAAPRRASSSAAKLPPSCPRDSKRTRDRQRVRFASVSYDSAHANTAILPWLLKTYVHHERSMKHDVKEVRLLHLVSIGQYISADVQEKKQQRQISLLVRV